MSREPQANAWGFALQQHVALAELLVIRMTMAPSPHSPELLAGVLLDGVWSVSAAPASSAESVTFEKSSKLRSLSVTIRRELPSVIEMYVGIRNDFGAFAANDRLVVAVTANRGYSASPSLVTLAAENHYVQSVTIAREENR